MGGTHKRRPGHEQIDQHVGAMIRRARLFKHMNQTELGEARSEPSHMSVVEETCRSPSVGYLGRTQRNSRPCVEPGRAPLSQLKVRKILETTGSRAHPAAHALR